MAPLSTVLLPLYLVYNLKVLFLSRVQFLCSHTQGTFTRHWSWVTS